MAFKDAPPCQAHNTAGEPCGNPAIRGLTVCYNHGGNTKNARAAAQRNVLALVEPAVGRLAEALQLGDPGDWQTVMRAIKEVLDRAGIDSPKQIEVFTHEAVRAEIERRRAERAEDDDAT